MQHAIVNDKDTSEFMPLKDKKGEPGLVELYQYAAQSKIRKKSSIVERPTPRNQQNPPMLIQPKD